jgi:hypothetical protein
MEPPGALVPLLMLAGRTIEIVGGFGLIPGTYPQIAVIAFLIPATLVGHGFWQVRGTPTYIPQLLQFLKNAAMTGGLLFIAATPNQPALFPRFLAHIDRLGRLQQSTKRDGRKNAEELSRCPENLMAAPVPHRSRLCECRSQSEANTERSKGGSLPGYHAEVR